MKTKINKILIGKDGYPVELVQNRPVLNFIRKLIHGKHYECSNCYGCKQQAKWSNVKEMTTEK